MRTTEVATTPRQTQPPFVVHPLPRPTQPASHPVELTAVATAEPVAPAAPSSEGGGEGVGLNNNYSRPQGQNVG